MKCLEKQSPMIRPVGYGLRSVRLLGALKIRFPGDQIFGQTILVIPFLRDGSTFCPSQALRARLPSSSPFGTNPTDARDANRQTSV
jgi:hypothetical protein